MTVVPARFWSYMLVLILGAAPGAAAEETSPLTLAWSAGPARGADGWPVSPAVRYQVFASRDGGPAEFLAEVTDDTTCVVALVRSVSYRFRVRGIDAEGRSSVPSAWSKAFVVHRPEASLPGLLGSSPNPFNPLTRISYAVPSEVAPGTLSRLEIFDVRGRVIRRLPVAPSPGVHTVEWHGTNDRGEAAADRNLHRPLCPRRSRGDAQDAADPVNDPLAVSPRPWEHLHASCYFEQ